MKIQTKSKKVNKTWLHQHVTDPYVQAAQKDGYRARAAYKLKEINETFKLIHPGQVVVDLGCAPGAWSQYLRRTLAPQGAAAGQLDGVIIGLDILPMEPIEDVHFIQGDFREESVLAQLQAVLAGREVDVVVSDMAPNLSGVATVDQARSIHLCELALDFAARHLKPGGQFVVKVFQGEGFMEFRRQMEAVFSSVQVRKPKASRDRSAEVYLLAKGLRRN